MIRNKPAHNIRPALWLSGGYHAEWYGRGYVLIASHRELTLREAAGLVLRWEAEDEAQN